MTLRAALLLATLGLITAYAAFQSGGMADMHWRVAMVTIAIVAVVYSLFQRKSAAPELHRRTRILLACILTYVGFQAVPLPLAVLDVLSPARAEATRALAAAGIDQTFASLSVAPGATLFRLFTIGTYVLIFLLVREVGWILRRSPWWVILPLALIAFAEAITGISQHVGTAAVIPAHGTFVNRNHFAGMLEIALPFTVLYPVYCALQMTQIRRTKVTGGALALCAVVAGTAIFVGILFSLSRMGFAATLIALFVIAAILVSAPLAPRWRLGALVALATLMMLAFVFLPPDQLIMRFAQLASSDQFKSETRLQLWTETLRLLSAYPLFGCGAGGYESAFLKFQDMVPMTAVEYAHNDYLHWLAELGIIGFVIAAALLTVVVAAPVSASKFHPTRAGRMIATGCIASFTAFLLHSVVDFQSFVPANALMMSWVAGLANSLTLNWEAISISDVLGTRPVLSVPVGVPR